MEIQLMADFYLEFLKFCNHFGKVLAAAFDDVADKSRELLENQKFMVDIKEMKADENCNKYIEDFIEFEIAQGIAFASGKNNRNLLRNHPKYEAYKNYVSTSWNISRGAWIFDFITELSRLLS